MAQEDGTDTLSQDFSEKYQQLLKYDIINTWVIKKARLDHSILYFVSNVSGSTLLLFLSINCCYPRREQGLSLSPTESVPEEIILLTKIFG